MLLAVKDVLVALLANCFPFPSLSLAFYTLCRFSYFSVCLSAKGLTVKSAFLAALCLADLGIVCKPAAEEDRRSEESGQKKCMHLLADCS